MFMESVNTTCINSLLIPLTIGFMADREEHESLTRLMQCATDATRGTSAPVRGYSDLASALNVSPQRVQNWRTRGVSIEVAVEAEKKWGCYACWILTGVRPATQPGGPTLTDEALEVAAALDQITDRHAREVAFALCRLAAIAGPRPAPDDDDGPSVSPSPPPSRKPAQHR